MGAGYLLGYLFSICLKVVVSRKHIAYKNIGIAKRINVTAGRMLKDAE